MQRFGVFFSFFGPIKPFIDCMEKARNYLHLPYFFGYITESHAKLLLKPYRKESKIYFLYRLSTEVPSLILVFINGEEHIDTREIQMTQKGFKADKEIFDTFADVHKHLTKLHKLKYPVPNNGFSSFHKQK